MENHASSKVIFERKKTEERHGLITSENSRDGSDLHDKKEGGSVQIRGGTIHGMSMGLEVFKRTRKILTVSVGRSETGMLETAQNGAYCKIIECEVKKVGL